jgi:hypothetical protein
VRAWIREKGFPLWVLLDLAGSAYLGASVRIPDPIPAVALQAVPVYRLEVATACFVVLYLVAIAFFLALDGRGFVEFGTRGLKAAQVVRPSDDEEHVALARQMKLQQKLEARLDRIDADLEIIAKGSVAQERRLQALECRR